jgi:hypothetical protein
VAEILSCTCFNQELKEVPVLTGIAILFFDVIACRVSNDAEGIIPLFLFINIVGNCCLEFFKFVGIPATNRFAEWCLLSTDFIENLVVPSIKKLE